jgi:hypothetical protein
MRCRRACATGEHALQQHGEKWMGQQTPTSMAWTHVLWQGVHAKPSMPSLLALMLVLRPDQ